MESKLKFIKLQCFNPLNKINHTIRDKKRLRNVTSWMCSLFPEIPEEAKICDLCRKEIGKLKVDNTNPSGSSGLPSSPINISEECSSQPEDPTFSLESNIVIEQLNTSIVELELSPINVKKIHSKQYATKKVKKINSALKRKLFVAAEDSSSDDENLDESILRNLKENFSNSTNRVKKLMILTCLPENWGIRKIMREFNASNYMVRQAKKLLKEKGILESPNPKPGKALSKAIVDTVKSFYENDEISRIMPGIKDCMTVVDLNGIKTKMSKRLILCNLKEAYSLFKEKFSDITIGFSKFAELRPKHCILAGQSGTHAVCVCTTHQNVKLMIENTKLGALTNGQLNTYKHCLAKMLCNPPNINCYMSECRECPGVAPIRIIIEEAFEENLIENVTYRQWVSVDRCNLETLQKSNEDFINVFCEKLTLLVKHDFVAKQQSSFINDKKENLKESEFVVNLDFSENYNIVVQDEAQSYHWASEHVTIHPFVIYYREDDKIKHSSFVVISPCLEHNTVSVYTFQKKLVEFMTTKFQTVPKKIFYYSDGCAAQYKNKKNFINLCYHKQDFGVEAEWHFSATAHGKGPCDGVGGSVKRLAARASLQRPYDNQILTPIQLYEWAVENLSGINFAFSTQDEYVESETFLNDRFSQAVTIKGTQQYHAYIPVHSSVSKICVKIFSEDTTERTVIIRKCSEKLQMSEVSGYITAVYDQKWWLAYVLEKNEEEDELKVTFLHPAGPSSSFSYPRKPDVLWISLTDVLCKVDPTTPTGRIYVITPEEATRTSQALSSSSI